MDSEVFLKLWYGYFQPVSLGLFRNDFMMDTKKVERNEDCSLSQIGENAQLKQIEFNTIASSFAGLVGALSDVHRYNSTAKIQVKAGNIFNSSKLGETM